MKSTITIFIVLAAAVCAPAATKKKADTAAAPQAVTIPKDAVPNADGTSYLYTDKQGKKWVYAKTPFGIIKNAYSESAAAAAPAADTATTKVIDQGETVKFEQPGPFGTMSYEKKKTDLTDDERRMLAGSSAAGSSVDASTAKPQ